MSTKSIDILIFIVYLTFCIGKLQVQANIGGVVSAFHGLRWALTPIMQHKKCLGYRLVIRDIIVNSMPLGRFSVLSGKPGQELWERLYRNQNTENRSRCVRNRKEALLSGKVCVKIYTCYYALCRGKSSAPAGRYTWRITIQLPNTDCGGEGEGFWETARLPRQISSCLTGLNSYGAFCVGTDRR